MSITESGSAARRPSGPPPAPDSGPRGPGRQTVRRPRPPALRLRFALLLSIAIHALLLSLTLTGEEFGLPGLAFPWQVRRVLAPSLLVALAPAPAARSLPASSAPPPEHSIERLMPPDSQPLASAAPTIPSPPLPTPPPSVEPAVEPAVATSPAVVSFSQPEPPPPAPTTVVPAPAIAEAAPPAKMAAADPIPSPQRPWPRRNSRRLPSLRSTSHRHPSSSSPRHHRSLRLPSWPPPTMRKPKRSPASNNRNGKSLPRKQQGPQPRNRKRSVRPSQNRRQRKNGHEKRQPDGKPNALRQPA